MRMWKCKRCKKSIAFYLLKKIINDKKRLGICEDCFGKPMPKRKKEDKRITALKKGKKVTL